MALKRGLRAIVKAIRSQAIKTPAKASKIGANATKQIIVATAEAPVRATTPATAKRITAQAKIADRIISRVLIVGILIADLLLSQLANSF